MAKLLAVDNCNRIHPVPKEYMASSQDQPGDKLTDLSWNSSGTLVHHLRNSVGCLAGLLDMFKIKRDDKVFQDQFIRLAQQAIDTSVKLLEEFSSLTQPLELKCKPLQLEAWLKGLVSKHSLSGSPAIEVRWRIDGATLAPISADPAYLARAITAILDNAIEAMPEGGTLTITAHGDGEKRMDSLVFQDTGVGMDDDVLEHAFVPFFTIQNNKTGLGLSWAQKIVLAHGGEIKISSALHKGTSVSIQVPTDHRRASAVSKGVVKRPARAPVKK